MNFSEQPSHILDAWFLFESFRRLGFASRDIYALVTKNEEDQGNLWFGMLLRTQKKEFAVFIRQVEDEDVLKEWSAFASRLADGQFGQQDMQHVWAERLNRLGGEALVYGLLTNGFYLPLSKH